MCIEIRNYDFIDMLGERFGADYIGDLISQGYKFSGVQCNCGKTIVMNPTRNTKLFKCPICDTVPSIVNVSKPQALDSLEITFNIECGGEKLE